MLCGRCEETVTLFLTNSFILIFDLENLYFTFISQLIFIIWFLKTAKQFCCCSFRVSLEIKPKVWFVLAWVSLTFRSLCLTFICGWNKITKLVLFSDCDFLSFQLWDFQMKLILKMFHSLIPCYLDQNSKLFWLSEIFSIQQFDKV